MRNAILANAQNDPIIAAIIANYMISQVPILAGPLTRGALLGAGSGAASPILNTVANIPGVDFAQVVADVNNDPQITPETKQASNTVLTTIVAPAVGGGEGDGGDTGDDFVTEGEDTAKNPAQTTETNPQP